MRESREAKRSRTRRIIRELKKSYPDAKIALDFGNPLELLVATILSAQCTDERVNLVTPALFERYRTAADFARRRSRTSSWPSAPPASSAPRPGRSRAVAGKSTRGTAGGCRRPWRS